MKNKLWKINIVVIAIMVSGFLLSATSFYMSFEKNQKDDIETVSEVTSENIYANINNLIDLPLNVSVSMAHDTFFRDFVANERDSDYKLEKIQEYLTSYNKRYGFNSVFFVSNNTQKYYHYKTGVDRILSTDVEEDKWYFDFLNSNNDIELNIDNDEAREDDSITVFVNCKLKDTNGDVLGVVGVGMETPYIQNFFAENEQRYDIRAFLVDKDGNLQVSSSATKFENINLFDDYAFKDMISAININEVSKGGCWYHGEKYNGYIITKYISGLNWYLIVEKNTEVFETEIGKQTIIGGTLSIITIVIMMTVISVVITKNNKKIVLASQRDNLTGIKNRTAYSDELEWHRTQLEKYKTFGIGIFDLNNLKITNDVYGHQEGDKIIKEFSRMLCEVYSHNPVFRIGGDEFAVLFIDSTKDEVDGLLNNFNGVLAEYNCKNTNTISAAFGYEFLGDNGNETLEDIFKAADDNMYENKEILKCTCK